MLIKKLVLFLIIFCFFEICDIIGHSDDKGDSLLILNYIKKKLLFIL